MNSSLIGLDPLFLTNVKLLIKDVLELEQGTEHKIDTFKLYSHDIKFAEICGTIVAVETNSRIATYSIDDGTGTIPCTYWIDDFSFRPIKIGTSSLIYIINVSKLLIEHCVKDELFDHNQEILHLCQAIAMRKEYKKQFVIPTRVHNSMEALVQQFNNQNTQRSLPSTQSHEREDTIIMFEEALLDYLKTIKHGRFSITKPLDNLQLNDLAEKFLQKQQQITPTKKDINNFILAALDNLILNGDVIEYNKEANLYKVIGDSEIREIILTIVRDATDQLEDFCAGIRIEYILTKVAQTPMYASIRKEKIKAIINELVRDSFIYPVADKEFKIVE